LTVGISNTDSEIEKTVEILKKVVKELRAFSPLKEKYGF
jgi:cysteine desulfurase